MSGAVSLGFYPKIDTFYKELTFSIEATNSGIRHRLARFKRHSKASSRSVDGTTVASYFLLRPEYPENLDHIISIILWLGIFLEKGHDIPPQ